VRVSRRAFAGGAIGLAALPALAQEGVVPPIWQEGVPLPFAVQEIYPTLWRGRLVVGGGFRSVGPGPVTRIADLRPSADVVAMQPGGRRWEALPSLPEARHHPLLAVLGGNLLAVGGFSATPDAVWTMQAQCWVLEPGASRWRDGPALPVPQAEVAAGVIGGALIVAGGRTPWDGRNGQYADHRDTGAAWMLAPGAKAWEAMPPLPTPRNSSAAAVLDGRLHVTGGRVVRDGGLTNLTVHEAWDPKRERWVTLAPMPEARGGHAAAVVGSRMLCFGGESFGPEGRAHDEVFLYREDGRGRWKTIETMPRPLHGLGAVAVGDAIHLLGGASEVGGRATTASHLEFNYNC
jgi:N-acetylneuraminic acid mutarotase